MMKKMLVLTACLATLFSGASCSARSASNADGTTKQGENKVLVAYFSWGGTTRQMAEEISRAVGGDLYRITPERPYPEDYTACTEVARRERDNDERPAIAGQVARFDDYDVVFIGCPVWWHTAPMIVATFAEQYDFKGKTVVPFCTYAETYRDETLARIAALTPEAKHLKWFGSTGNWKEALGDWLKEIGLSTKP